VDSTPSIRFKKITPRVCVCFCAFTLIRRSITRIIILFILMMFVSYFDFNESDIPPFFDTSLYYITILLIVNMRLPEIMFIT
jgi:hypothetical protein